MGRDYTLTNSQTLYWPGPSIELTIPLSRWPRRATAHPDRISRISFKSSVSIALSASLLAA